MSDLFSLTVPVADILRSPDGPRDRQAVMGQLATVLDQNGIWSKVEMIKDGYTGFIKTAQLGPPIEASHRIISRASHAYDTADFKSRDLVSLSHGSLITVTTIDGKFARTAHGYIPLQHIAPIGTLVTDTIRVARQFLGTPYLWGGNSAWGIDCSGLVQAAMLACGIPCQGDSGQQAETLGRVVPLGSAFATGDILFWKGHVGLVSGPDSLIHANAHHMAVVEEPLAAAINRIKDNGDGPVTGHRRV